MQGPADAVEHAASRRRRAIRFAHDQVLIHEVCFLPPKDGGEHVHARRNQERGRDDPPPPHRPSIDLRSDERKHQKNCDLEMVRVDELHGRDEENAAGLQERQHEEMVGRAAIRQQHAHHTDRSDDEDHRGGDVDRGGVEQRLAAVERPEADHAGKAMQKHACGPF